MRGTVRYSRSPRGNCMVQWIPSRTHLITALFIFWNPVGPGNKKSGRDKTLHFFRDLGSSIGGSGVGLKLRFPSLKPRHSCLSTPRIEKDTVGVWSGPSPLFPRLSRFKIGRFLNPSHLCRYVELRDGICIILRLPIPSSK